MSNKIKETTGNATYNDTYDAARDVTWIDTRVAVDDATWKTARIATWTATSNDTHNAIHQALEHVE